MKMSNILRIVVAITACIIEKQQKSICIDRWQKYKSKMQVLGMMRCLYAINCKSEVRRKSKSG
jgi:hypothetical protein